MGNNQPSQLSKISLPVPIEDSIFSWIPSVFPFTFGINFVKNIFAKASSTDLVWLLQVSD